MRDIDWNQLGIAAIIATIAATLYIVARIWQTM